MVTANIGSQDIIELENNAIKKSNDLPKNRKHLGKLDIVVSDFERKITKHFLIGIHILNKKDWL